MTRSHELANRDVPSIQMYRPASASSREV